MLTDMLLTILTAFAALASSIDASPGTKEKLSLFCFTSEECKDMHFCANHQCRIFIKMSEFKIVSKIYSSRQRQVSNEGHPCLIHTDCRASRFCDVQDGVCRRFEEVFGKVKCKSYKKPCRSNADCSCPGHQMICEQEYSGIRSECVDANSKRSSLSSSTRASSQGRNDDLRTIRLSTRR